MYSGVEGPAASIINGIIVTITSGVAQVSRLGVALAMAAWVRVDWWS